MQLPKRWGWRRLRLALAVVTVVGASAAVAEGAIPYIGSPFLESGVVTNYVAYTHGHAGAANAKLSPIVLGWVNNQGGSIPTYAPLATPAAEFSVNYINKYLGGIDGHPLKLQECFVKNAEEEGLHCGEEFLSNKNVVGVLYGAVAVGANSINSTIAGKKPIIEMYNLNPSDQSNKNTYLLYGSGSFAVYGWGTFGAQVLHAKTGAILYPESPGNEQGAAGMAQAMDAAGIKTKLVGFAADATDLTGALTAAGGQNVDMIGTYSAAASQCINFYKAVQQLGISPEKVVTFQECVTPQIQAALGGKLPKVYLGVAQSADDLTSPLTPVGKAFIKALETAYGSKYKNQAADPWYPATFGLMLTVAEWMNKIGAKNVNPTTLAAQAKAFKGPLLLGSPVIHCGKYPSAPAVCADGDHFFQSVGNGTFKSVSGWVQTPIQLQKQLHAKGVS